jgi:hypothetical protein
MKKIIGLLVLLLITGSKLALFGQNTIEITGKIKSSQGALHSVEIRFYTSNGNFLSNCISGPEGEFQKLLRIDTGATIRIRINKPQHREIDRVIRINRPGFIGEFMLQPVITISGFAKDSAEGTPLKDVSILFNEDSEWIQGNTSNSEGNFQFETKYMPGNDITFRITKNGYYEKFITHSIKNGDRNVIESILLPKIGDRGIKAFIAVVDKKTSEPIPGATIRYLEAKRTTYVDSIASSKGWVELKLNQQPGTNLNVEISKAGYKTIKKQLPISSDPAINTFTFQMEKRRRPTGAFLLIGGIASASVGTAMYISSNTSYDRYKDFTNINREKEYDKAQRKRNISFIAGSVAAGCFAAYIIHTINRRKAEKATAPGINKTGFKLYVPVNHNYATTSFQFIGLAYRI